MFLHVFIIISIDFQPIIYESWVLYLPHPLLNNDHLSDQ